MPRTHLHVWRGTAKLSTLWWNLMILGIDRLCAPPLNASQHVVMGFELWHPAKIVAIERNITEEAGSIPFGEVYLNVMMIPCYYLCISAMREVDWNSEQSRCGANKIWCLCSAPVRPAPRPPRPATVYSMVLWPCENIQRLKVKKLLKLKNQSIYIESFTWNN